jgi:hypothetical protein
MNKGSKKISRAVMILMLFNILIHGFIFNPKNSVNAQSGTCVANFQSVAIPLTELGNSIYTRMDGTSTGFAGGLYPNGENSRPANHEQSGIAIADTILPVDINGNYDPDNGKIIFLSIGMSNTNMEFETFQQMAQDDPNTNSKILFLNGALSSQTSDRWLDPNAITWQNIADRLNQYGLSPDQVQVVWIKLTQTKGGDFPAKAQSLESDLKTIVRNLKSAYPNTKIAYLSSRIYSYTYFRGLSPEPNAYETGFSVKWLIEKQINGDSTLNFDPEKGVVVAPYLSWGPYLWANGTTPRADGLVWFPEDFEFDCTHPSVSGRQKVGTKLLDFFKGDTTSKPWFTLQTDNENTIFLPVITNTATPVVVDTSAPTSPPTRSPTIVPSAEIAITLTPVLSLPVQPAQQPVNIFVMIIEWFRKIFSRK